MADQDEKIALELLNKNQINYLKIQTTNNLGPGGSTEFTKASLTQLKSQTKKSNYLNLSNNDLLNIAERRRNDIFMLNGKSATLEEIEKIAIHQFHSAVFKDTWQQDKSQRKQYTLIFTEN
ncbi:hypothetical protein [Runella sp.]|uniref:hypothetical protein n=1 Tax=Runella sp. TaxID=1960881 RepID=UPI003D0C78B5